VLVEVVETLSEVQTEVRVVVMKAALVGILVVLLQTVAANRGSSAAPALVV